MEMAIVTQRYNFSALCVSGRDRTYDPRVNVISGGTLFIHSPLRYRGEACNKTACSFTESYHNNLV